MAKMAKLLRIFTDEAAYFGDIQVFQHISALAHEKGLAGITVLKALSGYGASAHVHRAHAFEHDRAVVIEIVDEDAKLRSFVNALADVPDIGLITLADVEILSEDRVRRADAGQG